MTHKFSIAGHEGYLTVGLYDDGQPGEIFLRMAKEGSTVSGLMDTIATMTSIALQYGVPLKALVDKFSHTRFEPSGFTNNPRDPDGEVGHRLRLPLARQPLPAASREVADEQETAAPSDDRPAALEAGASAVAGGSRRGAESRTAFVNQADAPTCSECGTIMVRNGACYKCPNCGATSGCS